MSEIQFPDMFRIAGIPLNTIDYFMVDTDVLSLTIESGVLYPPIISLYCDH